MLKKKSSLKIGSFVGLKKPNYLNGMIEHIRYIDGNAMMFFAGSPQIFRVLDWKKLDRQTFWNLLRENQWSLENICIHAHYLINLGNLTNFGVYSRSLQLLKNICAFAQALKIRYIILHPGSALKGDRQLSLKQVAKSLDQILSQYPEITICLETMSGKGSELGKTFTELKTIFDNMEYHQQMAICWDTCHLYSAGYDIKTKLNQVIAEFERILGLDKLLFIHLNDTKNPFQSHLDRHLPLGSGYLGWDSIFQLINHPQLNTKTWILETPHSTNLDGYRNEISKIKNHVK